MSVKVTALHCFPVKSMGGMSLSKATIDRFGIQRDRRWMVVDERGHFMTQRQCASMVHMHATVVGGDLLLRYKSDELLVLAQSFSDQRICQATVWRDQVDALVADDSVNAWLSSRLARPCRLVFMPDTTRREVDDNYAKAGETVSFADGFPLLLATEASLDDFNQHLSNPIEMLRFRPNLVLSGSAPWAEDEWRTIKVGTMTFSVVKPCSRCVIPTINRNTAVKESEVFRVLKKYRQRGGDVFFGQNLLSQGQGKIEVGDKVELLD